MRTIALATVLITGLLVGSASAGGFDLARSYNDFGFALLHRLAGSQPNHNVIVSPASVAIALAMTANGARGPTRQAILTTLRAPGGDMPAFNAANQRLLEVLEQPEYDLRFSIANALWLSSHFALQPSFAAINQKVFAATARTVEFGDPSAAATINAWVKQQTNGMIPRIVDSTDPLDAAILTNAIAMKAAWLTPFKKSETHDAPFHTGGATAVVSMMERSGAIGYAQTGGWQIARLPYRGDRFAMYVFLPKAGTPLSSAVREFDARAFDSAIAGVKEQPLQLAMPRFTATYATTLNEALVQLGMAVAFGDGADFSNLVRSPLQAKISRVNHRVFLRVDEEGTEAAAATSVEIRTLMGAMPPETSMIVDRPFFLVVRDDRSQQILFAGEIYQPH